MQVIVLANQDEETPPHPLNDHLKVRPGETDTLSTLHVNHAEWIDGRLVVYGKREHGLCVYLVLDQDVVALIDKVRE